MDKKNGLEVPSGAFSFSDYLSNVYEKSVESVFSPQKEQVLLAYAELYN